MQSVLLIYDRSKNIIYGNRIYDDVLVYIPSYISKKEKYNPKVRSVRTDRFRY